MAAPRLRVGPYAKWAFVVPAVLLVLGLTLLIATPRLCGSGPPCSTEGNGTCPALGTVCVYPAEGLGLVVLGMIALPLAVLFYRSRRYAPLD